jgi:hypothetical protein
MLRRAWLGFLSFGLGVVLVAAVPSGAADKASPETIAKLVEKLGSTEFSEREKATRELEALGEQALDALRKAAKGDDLETKRRAEELIKKVESRQLTKKVLEPSKIRFAFKDTPLREAIEEVNKKTGLNIILNDPENKLADRKVTLDTGETTLWEAVDQFVAKAGLVESVNPAQVIGPGVRPVPQPRPPIKPLPVPPKQIQPAPLPIQPQLDVPQGAIQVQVQVQVQAQPAQADPAQPVPPQPAPLLRPGRPPFFGYQPNTLVLTDGKAEALPTQYAGAVRIRALPAGTAILGFAPREGELTIALQVTPEPKLQFQSLVDVRIDKAVDDQGQVLMQSTADAGNGGNDVPVAGALVAKAAFVARVPAPAPGVAPVPVRLKKGDKPSKTLKELTGVVSIQVRTPAEALMTIEKLMDAAGKEVKGEAGGRIKVLDVAKDDKATTLKIEFEPPPDVQAGGVVPGPILIQPVPLPVPVPQQLPQKQLNAVPGALQVQVQPAVQPVPVPAVPIAPAAPAGFNGLTVLDEKGNALPMQPTNIQPVKAANGVMWQYTFTLPVVKDQGAPAKLVFTGSKVVTVDVPFTLKGVPVQ